MADPVQNSTRTGGFLTPQPPYPVDDAALDAVIQALVVGITGLDPTLVRPRWQPVVPQQPPVTTNWCAIGVMSSTPDDGPYIAYDPATNSGPYVRHETLDVLATFYGPNSKQYCAQLRDGIAVNQNCEILIPYQMAYVACGAIRAVPELTNQQWVKRQDMPITFRRKVFREYAIDYIAIAEIKIVTGVNSTTEHVVADFTVPPGSTLEP